jgi:SAM-dependent methyltransferase
MSVLDPAAARRLVIDTVAAADFRRATFAGPQRGRPSPWLRITIRPVEIRGERHLQISHFDARKDVSENVPAAQIAGTLAVILNVGYAGIHLTTTVEQIDLRTTKKGKILVGKKKADSSPEPLAHNRTKDVPLPEGRADRLLETMGILTSSGQVKPTMRAKFTQINEFLKHLTHVLGDADLRGLGREITLLDCGCGSSYLTLAVHHYLNDVLHLSAKILGVDVNDEVIRKSIAKSERLGAERIAFSCGPIESLDVQPDIVLALHACDTATDDALAQAIRREARIVLAAPCCHHELKLGVDSSALRPLLRHGILRERTADLVTDALRALLLRIMGYRTDVVEFVSHEHTPRNLLIRAVRGTPIGEPKFVEEYREMCRLWQVTPYLATLLGKALMPPSTG